MGPTWAPKSLNNRSKSDLAAQRPPRSLQGPILGPNWAYVKPFWASNWPQECSFQTANARATFAKLALHNARLARLFTLAACSVAGFGGAAPLEIRPLSLLRLKVGPRAKRPEDSQLRCSENPQSLPQVNFYIYFRRHYGGPQVHRRKRDPPKRKKGARLHRGIAKNVPVWQPGPRA